MATIENPSGTKHHPVKRLIKKSTKVDLTPMVDLGFLLITFFVFTTTMAKATAMKIVMPVDTKPGDNICNSCALTTILCDNNVIKYYEGAIETAAIKTADYNNIRHIIQQKKKKIFEARGSTDEFVLIIKPAATSSFKNFVDIADEVAINLVTRYYIDDLNDLEKKKINF